MRRVPQMVLLAALFLAVPGIALAQDTSIAGVVRDASGGVLPGVTVEASSPALIEKVRTAVTDGSGQYRIIALVPGTYTVTFILEGFSKVERTGIELRAETILPVNAEMKVGTLVETITVTGASPVVDLQTVSSVTVMTRDVIDQVPLAKNLQSIGILIPGTSLQSSAQTVTRDVGGNSNGDTFPLSYRGSTNSVTAVDGMRVSAVVASGQYGVFQNLGGAQEVSYNTGADSAEMGQAGLRINVVPKEGGNTFRGVISGDFTGGDAWNSYNLSDQLKQYGITSVSKVRHIFDFNPSYGGPVVQDKLWFFGTARVLGVDKIVTDTFYDGNPDPFRYSPDESRPGFDDNRRTSFQGRLTWAMGAKNKLSGYIDKQTKFVGHIAVSSTNLPEASSCQCYPFMWLGNLKWTSTVSNRLLFEAGWSPFNLEWDYLNQPDVPITTFRINDQTTSRTFGAPGAQQRNISYLNSYTAKLTWVTGMHSLSGGLNGNQGTYRVITTRGTGDVSELRFGNLGIGAVGADATGYGPNRVSLALPTNEYNTIDGDNGFWVTDRMTYKRATITAGLRFDWFKGSVGTSSVLENKWSDTVTYQGFNNAPHWRDLSPRLGFAYDLFGNGKTALKVGASKYIAGETIGTAASVNPINTLDDSINLTWTDNNGDRTIFNPDGTVQDRDLKNGDPTQNELAPIPANDTFGQLVPSTTITDTRITNGYGVRGYTWEYSAGVQHELFPRVSVNFNYYRRNTAGNHVSTDNVNIGPEHYQGPYCVTTPVDPRLPNGGGWDLCGIYQLRPEGFGIATQNVQTFTKDHIANAGSSAKRITYNHGYDITVNARLTTGTIVQGGVNADRSVSDTCYTAAFANPTTLQLNPITGDPFCHTVGPFRPDVKLLASHPLWWGLNLSGTYQRTPGPSRSATWTISQATAQAEGWAISTAPGSTQAQINAATTSFSLFQTGQHFEKPLNQLDLRFSKRFSLRSGQRLLVNFDVYNAFNNAWVYVQNGTLGTNYTTSSTWLRPSQVLQARMLKIGGQFDF